jgi:NADH-quinone oxidoreductase subunit F
VPDPARQRPLRLIDGAVTVVKSSMHTFPQEYGLTQPAEA